MGRNSKRTALLLAALGLGFGPGPRLARAGGGEEHTTLTTDNGDTAAIPSWDIQSTAQASKNLPGLAQPGARIDGWTHAPLSRCTLMACLLAAGKYKEDELWYSDNLAKFDKAPFDVPWLYRSEFALDPGEGRYYTLVTHGITSEADVWLNGRQVANATFQAGSYGGHEYDITGVVGEKNALLVQAHPTHYWYDLAVGFGDWNPYAPDNGTGVWRDVEVRQTGPVASGPLAVLVDLPLPAGEKPATVTLRTEARNLGASEVTFRATAKINAPGGCAEGDALEQDVHLAPGKRTVVEFTHTVPHPQVWWPAQWGEQPLYSASVELCVGDEVSDRAAAEFGIRSVTSSISSMNDTTFTVNGHPFQVVGAGYNADQFLRWDTGRWEVLARQILALGHNTVRLEGKMEQPELYAVADRLGIMVMAGWECCDKWESWAYNDELSLNPPPVWDDREYGIAAASMAHEAATLQTHPSVLTFLIGSDYSPDKRATALYVQALKDAGWALPVLGGASAREPAVLKSGLKMNGPYDWVPPNYWHDVHGLSPAELGEERFGAAFGFGSELGAGVGTPELRALRRFLSPGDLDDLWKSPAKGLYHMSNADSQFHDRAVYDAALRARYGAPASLEDYVLKAQVADYEATRAEFEGYASRWGAERPATGVIYWMLNSAWPALHWALVDRYGGTGGAFFGAATGGRVEHAAYDYVSHDVWLINRSLRPGGGRTVEAEVVGLDGARLAHQTLEADTQPNKAFSIGRLELPKFDGVVFLRLLLKDGDNVLSRNVYWLSKGLDELDWPKSDWWHTPVTHYADYTALARLKPADVAVTTAETQGGLKVALENRSPHPAFFVSLALVDAQGHDAAPVAWSDNYVTLWPGEKLELTADVEADWDKLEVKGWNVAAREV